MYWADFLLSIISYKIGHEMRIPFGFLALGHCIAFSLALNPPSYPSIQSPQSALPPYISAALSSATGNANFSNAQANAPPVCNGALLGYQLTKSTCFQAWSRIPTTDLTKLFQDRGFGASQVALPRRYIDRKSANHDHTPPFIVSVTNSENSDRYWVQVLLSALSISSPKTTPRETWLRIEKFQWQHGGF